MSILGWPVMSRTSSVVAVASSADTFATTLYLPAATVFGGRTLSLTSFDWPGSSGSALSSWLPYCSVKVASKFCGAVAERLDHHLLAAVVLDAELKLEGRLRGAAQLRQLRIERELGRQVGRERHRDRQAGVGRRPLRIDGQVGGADRGVLAERRGEARAARWHWWPAARPRPAGRRRSASRSSRSARRRPRAPAARAEARSSAA